MAQQYVRTDYPYLAAPARQHITFVTTRPEIPPAPGTPSLLPDENEQPQTVQPAVNLDEHIRKRREKARRMKQR